MWELLPCEPLWLKPGFRWCFRTRWALQRRRASMQSLCVRVCVCVVSLCLCPCVRVCISARASTHTYIYIYIYVCTCTFQSTSVCFVLSPSHWRFRLWRWVERRGQGGRRARLLLLSHLVSGGVQGSMSGDANPKPLNPNY